MTAEATGEQVVSGGASFQRSGENLTVTTGSNRTIINWQGFGVPQGGFAKFVQPGSNSAVLNRVTGALPSRIDGALSSNGRVYLINPNGIVVGPTGTINTAGFVASTLDVSNQEFLAGGNLTFSGPSDAAVVNLGSIYAASGDIVMIARHVENAGTLSAPNGTVALGAGAEILLMETGQERIAIRPSGASAGGTGILNTGNINALAAELKANGNMYALAINTQGVIRATGAENVGGRVILRADGGKIVHSGTLKADYLGADGFLRGGEVQILGREVTLTDDAVVDVSGARGGGRAYIGGNFQGQGPLPNADYTLIGDLAKIYANAGAEGDGGSVVVWADKGTGFWGSIEARGGTHSGHGGAVEVSGKQQLIFRGRVDLDAPKGATGTLLLDPQDIVIQGGTADGTADADALNNTFGGATVGSVLFSEFAGAVTIRESEIESLNADIVLEAANSITVSGVFGGATLTLQSNRNLTMRTRNNSGDETGSPTAAGINTSGITIQTQGTGSITMITGFGNGATAGNGLAGNITTSALTTAGGSVTLDARNAGTIQSTAITTTGAAGRNGGNVTITGTNSVTLTGALAANGGANAGAGGFNAGTVQINAGTISTAAITANGSAGAAGNFNGGNAGLITLTSTGTVTATGTLTSQNGNATGNGAGGTAQGVTVSGTTINLAAVTTSGNAKGNGGDVTISGTSVVTLTGAVTTSGGTGINSAGGNGGKVSITGADVVAVSMTANGGNGVAGAVLDQNGGKGGDILLKATDGSPTITLNGNLSSTGGTRAGVGVAGNGGAVDLNGAVTLTGNSTIVSNGAAGGGTGGNVHFFSTVDGTFTLGITPGTGNVTFDGAVGGTTRLNTITITGGSTLTLGGNISTNNAAITASTITALRLNNNIVIDTDPAGGVTAGAAVSFGTAPITGDVTGRTLTIDTSADGGGTSNTVAVGPMNTGNLLGALTILSTTTTLNGSITLADVAGNNVSITGAVTLANAAGTTLTIDTNGATNKGNITITGLATGAGRGFTLTGAVINSGGATTTGTNNIVNPGHDGGNVSITGTTVTVGAITTNGGAGGAANLNGGNAGTISITASTAINLGGNFSSVGGALSGAGTAGNGGAVDLNGAVTLTGNRTITSNGAAGGGTGGNVHFFSTVDGTFTLGITPGTGNVTFDGAVGGTTRLNAITITGGSTLTLGGNISTNNAAVTAATITALRLNANIVVDTDPAGGVAAGAAVSFGTAPITGDVTGRTLTIDTSADGGGGSNTVAVGPMNAGNLLGALTILSTTTTLGGSITLADVAGNNVSITGAVTLGNAAGTTLTIDTNGATNKGNITITGLTTGAGRGFTLTGAVINSGGVTTSGTSNIVNPGHDGGNVSITGTTVTVGAITTNGGAGGAANLNGGNAGTISITASTAINLGGNFSSVGGALSGAGTAGNGGAVDLNGPVTLTGNRTITSNGAAGGGTGGNVHFFSTVDGTFTLGITPGTGNVTFDAAVGSTARLNAITITGGSTLTLGGNISTNNAAISATTITALRLNANIVIDTDPAGGAVGGGSVSFGSAPITGDIAGRTLTIDTSADGGGASNTVAVGPMNTGNLLGALTILSTTTTLGGSITLADVTGNNVSITGAVTLANAAGTTLTIDTNGTTNKGNITITGVATGAGRGFTLTGAVINSGGATTTGTNNIVNPGHDGGNVSITGTTVTVGAITTNGGNGGAANLNGGNAGTISITASTAINLGGNFSSVGGTLSGAGTAGNGGAVDLNGPVTLTGNRTITSNGAAGGGTGGNVHFFSTVDGTFTLGITPGNGNVTFDGAVGGTTRLNAITITGGSTLTLGGNISTNNAAISATTITALRLNNNIVIDTDPAGGVAAGGSVSFGSAPITGDVTGRTLTIDTSADGGGASNTVAVGPMNTGNLLGALTILSTTTTLNGNITLADVAGNNVSITGAVTLANAAGTTFTIDTNGATNKGNITVTGLATGAGRGFTLNGANISSGGANLGGGAGVNGGSFTISASGSATVTGTITTSGGAATAALVSGNAGNITVTGTSISLAALTANGGNGIAANPAGGAAGVIQITTAGNVNITGAISIRGGAASGTAAGGAPKSLTISGAIVNTAAITASGQANGAGSSVTINATGALTISGAITTAGGTANANTAGTAAGTVTLTGSTVTLTSVTASGSAANGGVNLNGGNGAAVQITANGPTQHITFNGDITTAGGARTGTGVGGNGADIDLNGNVTMTGARTLTATGGANSLSDGHLNVTGTFDGDVANRNLTVNAGRGDITFGGNMGATIALGIVTLNSSGATNLNFNVTSSQLVLDGNGTANLGGNITTTGQQIYGDPVTLTGNVSLTTTNGIVTFNGTIDSDGVGPRNFSISSGTGAITLNGNLGATRMLGDVVLNETRVTTNADMQIFGTVNAVSLTLPGDCPVALFDDITTINGQYYGGLTYVKPLTTETLHLTTTNSGAIYFADELTSSVLITMHYNLVIDAGEGAVTVVGDIGLFQSDRELGSLTVNAGSIDFLSQLHVVQNNLRSGNVSLTATNDIHVSDIQTLSTNAAGSTIQITSLNGSITAGGLTSTGTTDGGTVALDAPKDIVFSYANLSGSNKGGTLDVTTPELVRITGLIPSSPYSVDASGAVTSGSVTIRFGGLGVTPFIVGNSAVSGSAGGLTTGANTLMPSRTLFADYIDGTLEILSGWQEPPSQNLDTSLLDFANSYDQFERFSRQVTEENNLRKLRARRGTIRFGIQYINGGDYRGQGVITGGVTERAGSK